MFQKILDIQYPRLLSQACRDENSPFYGCYDRNWWHYRIRDFSSIMLQQGGYTAFQYAKNPEYKEYQQGLLQLAAASAMFWNERSRKKGAFEEYYPWEQGYPPLAFSTLAMTKLYLEGLIEKELISDGIKLAARQLQKRFEFQAGNQQVAGLAALAAIRKIEPELVSEEKYKEQKRKTLALQVEEGWYTEYDGPDLGYLSVTLDCLWDLYDITEDADYLNSAEKAFDFLYAFIGRRFEGAGMHNARNTDYIVPYGICRFLETKNSEASFLLHTLYLNLDDKEHFFYAVDDRYWSHYIGHSVARAQLILSAGKIEINDVKTPALDASFTFEESGYIFRKLNDVSSILISTKKGGVFSIFSNSETLFNDFGWITASGKKQFARCAESL